MSGMSNFEHFLGLDDRLDDAVDVAIAAEQILGLKIKNNNYSAAIQCCRKAEELAIRYIYEKDDNLSIEALCKQTETYNTENNVAHTTEPSLYDMLRYYVFRDQIGREQGARNALNDDPAIFLEHLDYIREKGNLHTHETKDEHLQEVECCFKYLFELFQYIARKYFYNIYMDMDREYNISLFKQKFLNLQEVLRRKNEGHEFDSMERAAENNFDKYRRYAEQNRTNAYIVRLVERQLKSLGWDEKDIEKGYVFEAEHRAGYETQKVGVDIALLDKRDIIGYVHVYPHVSLHYLMGQQERLAALRENEDKPYLYGFVTDGINYWILGFKLKDSKVNMVFSKPDILKIIQRGLNYSEIRKENKFKSSVPKDSHQKIAVEAVCKDIFKGERKHLLCMSPKSGKTLVSMGIIDVLFRCERAEKVLYLTKNVISKHEVAEKLRGCSVFDKDFICEFNSGCASEMPTKGIVVATYDELHTAINMRSFTPAMFEIIFMDDFGRRILNKYKDYLDFFFAHKVGLTSIASKSVYPEVYEYFNKEYTPTYSYIAELPYHRFECNTFLLSQERNLNDLDKQQQNKLKSDYSDCDEEQIKQMLKQIFDGDVLNRPTLEAELNFMVEHAITTKGKHDRDYCIGKTVIFAEDINMANGIAEILKLRYYFGEKTCWVKIAAGEDQNKVIDDFKAEDGECRILIVTDALDNGLDVPDCVNIAFFKRVSARAKFERMLAIAAGKSGEKNSKHPLCCKYTINGYEYTEKKHYFVFDFCRNFASFANNPNGEDNSNMLDDKAQLDFMWHAKFIQCLSGKNKLNNNDNALRDKLVCRCIEQIKYIDTKQYPACLHIAYIKKYEDPNNLLPLTNIVMRDLATHIRPFVIDNNYTNYTVSLCVRKLMWGILYGKIAIYEKSRYFNFLQLIREKLPVSASYSKEEFSTLEGWTLSDLYDFISVGAEVAKNQGLENIERGVKMCNIPDFFKEDGIIEGGPLNDAWECSLYPYNDIEE